MASTVWKGQLTFGLVSFPVRLVRAARKVRIPLKMVRGVDVSRAAQELDAGSDGAETAFSSDSGEEPGPTQAIEPVHQHYVAVENAISVPSGQLARAYEVEPDRFAVVGREELQRLRRPTSSTMQILRSVRMQDIDPVFLETSYYVSPTSGGEHSYALLYRALRETDLVVLAEVAMHGRNHVMVIRPGEKGLIAHTMYYVDEVRVSEEFVAQTTDLSRKELDLAKRFAEAIADEFRPEEFTDHYRVELEALLAATHLVPQRGKPQNIAPDVPPKVVDIMEALKQSLASVAQQKKERSRKPAAKQAARRTKQRAS